MDIKNQIISIIKETLQYDGIIDVEDTFTDLKGADSMNQLIIIREIENFFSISFEFEDLLEVEIVSDLIILTEKTLSRNDS